MFWHEFDAGVFFCVFLLAQVEKELVTARAKSKSAGDFFDILPGALKAFV